MSIEERIAEVVGDHWPGGGGGFCEGCDWIFEGQYRSPEPYPWSLHLAAVLVQELGLRQQWAQRWPYEDGHVTGVECEERDVAQVGIADTPGSRLVTRHVTDWIPDDF